MTLAMPAGRLVASHSIASVVPQECPRMWTGPGVKRVPNEIELFDESLQRPQLGIARAIRLAAIELVPCEDGPRVARTPPTDRDSCSSVRDRRG